MSAVVVFIIFAICLIIAIPISISLGIVAVLPGAFDAFFSQHFRRQYRNVGGNVCVPPQDETLVFCYRNATDPHFTDRRCHLALSSGLISFIII